VIGGGTIAFPLLTAYTNLANINDQYRTLAATGAGSAIDLHNLQSITNGQSYDTNLTIQAAAGGSIDLSGVTQIADPTSGNQSYRAINVAATGAGSIVNLSALISFTDNYAG